MLGLDHSITPVLLNTKDNWFDFKGRSYYKDSEAVNQVMEEGDEVKDIVEAIYVETNPLPLGSVLNVKDLTVTHFESLISKESNRPGKGFLESLKALTGAR